MALPYGLHPQTIQYMLMDAGAWDIVIRVEVAAVPNGAIHIRAREEL